MNSSNILSSKDEKEREKDREKNIFISQNLVPTQKEDSDKKSNSNKLLSAS